MPNPKKVCLKGIGPGLVPGLAATKQLVLVIKGEVVVGYANIRP